MYRLSMSKLMHTYHSIIIQYVPLLSIRMCLQAANEEQDFGVFQKSETSSNEKERGKSK